MKIHEDAQNSEKLFESINDGMEFLNFWEINLECRGNFLSLSEKFSRCSFSYLANLIN